MSGQNKLKSKSKSQLGQFYTTNYEYILQSFVIPEGIKKIIEPFAGNGDLVQYIESFKKKYEVECYDIDPKKDYIKMRDTLNDPPDYKDAYVITNPPYLARNKCEKKELFDKYDTNDLYKCFMEILIKKIGYALAI
jgi:tRNA1(Val) A37 N6-methylase TrmN6